jgi:hypothetical protein
MRSRIFLRLLTITLLIFSVTVPGAALANASQTDCRSYGYACTPGYTGANASGTWAWNYYGGSWAKTANG